jgi:hypothetical protein
VAVFLAVAFLGGVALVVVLIIWGGVGTLRWRVLFVGFSLAHKKKPFLIGSLLRAAKNNEWLEYENKVTQ